MYLCAEGTFFSLIVDHNIAGNRGKEFTTVISAYMPLFYDLWLEGRWFPMTKNRLLKHQ